MKSKYNLNILLKTLAVIFVTSTLTSSFAEDTPCQTSVCFRDAVVFGKLTSKENAPLPGITVKLGEMSVLSGPNGDYAFYPVPQGNHPIRFTDEVNFDYVDETSPQTITVAGGGEVERNFSLTRLIPKNCDLKITPFIPVDNTGWTPAYSGFFSLNYEIRSSCPMNLFDNRVPIHTIKIARIDSKTKSVIKDSINSYQFNLKDALSSSNPATSSGQLTVRLGGYDSAAKEFIYKLIWIRSNGGTFTLKRFYYRLEISGVEAINGQTTSTAVYIRGGAL